MTLGADIAAQLRRQRLNVAEDMRIARLDAEFDRLISGPVRGRRAYRDTHWPFPPLRPTR